MGTALEDASVPSGSPPSSFRLVVREDVPVERDEKHALSCRSCKTTPPFWMPDVGSFDAVTFGATLVALVAVAGCGGYLPARRATRVDPAVALKPR